MALTDISDHELLELAKSDTSDLTTELAGRFAEALSELDKSEDVIADQCDSLTFCAGQIAVLQATVELLLHRLAGQAVN